MMGFDKSRAKLRRGRISEKTFWLTAIVGGFLGVIVGGLLFHHKTAKPSFWFPVVIAVLLWIAIFWLY